MKKKIPLILLFIILIGTISVLGFFTYRYRSLYKMYKSQEDAESLHAKENEQAKFEQESKDNEKQQYLEENVYDNEIPIALYLMKGNNLVRADETYCDWKRDSILGLFYSLPSNEEIVPCSDYETLWKDLWAKYNTQGYKVGYNLKLHLDTGEEINRTLLDPIYVNDDIFSHIQLYLYDDVTYMPGRPYYHMTPEEMTDETMLTSIKLVGYKETKGVNGPIEVTVFTYNGPEDFDEITGEYIGNSKFTIKLYREQV